MQSPTEEEVKLNKELEILDTMHANLLNTYFERLFIGIGPYDETAIKIEAKDELHEIDAINKKLFELYSLSQEFAKIPNIKNDMTNTLIKAKNTLDSQKKSLLKRLKSKERQTMPLPQNHEELKLLLKAPTAYQQEIMGATKSSNDKKKP